MAKAELKNRMEQAERSYKRALETDIPWDDVRAIMREYQALRAEFEKAN